MLMDLAELVADYELDATGVLHLGAHLGEEADAYDDVGMPSVVWVEGDPDIYGQLVKALGGRPDHRAYQAVLDSSCSKVTFHVANNGQSSSILAMGTHLRHHPEVHYVREARVEAITLDQLWSNNGWSSLNFWNLDLQGAELRVLQGATRALSCCDYLYTEVNKEHVYRGCGLVEELDEYLNDFTRVATHWTPFGWGDAFYVREALLP